MMFLLEIEISRWPYRDYFKAVRNSGFHEEFLSENDFKPVLAAFFCYDYGANASQAVQKIATDQKDYHEQGFIQAFMLTSVFHEALSFVGSKGKAPGSFDYFSDPKFSNSLSMHHLVT